MNICIISPYDALSASNGASVRVFELSKGLSSYNVNVCVLHHGSSLDFNDRLKFIHFNFSNIPNGHNYMHPFNLSFIITFSKIIKSFKPDVIQYEQPWSTFPTLFIKSNNYINVLDEHNVEFLWMLKSSKIPIAIIFTYILEKIALKLSDHVLTCSSEDKNQIINIFGISPTKIFVSPNGVNSNLYNNSISSRLILRKQIGLSLEDKIILFHGRMDAKQNYEAVNIILTSIAPKILNAKFIIIGSKMPQWILDKAQKLSNVLVFDFVSNIKDYIKISDICIAPILTGSGTRLKILEYLAAGKPLVATTKSVEGLNIKNNIHALIHNSVNEDFIQSINRLMTDTDLSLRLGQNAKKLGLLYDWKIITNNLYKEYILLLKNRK